MMANLKIVTDSSSTMEPSVRDALAIHVVPLSVMIDGVVYACLLYTSRCV
ncbi:DegV family protein [Enterococcus sp. 3C8_DIV0646]|nr:DegV family protein [Enterococcus sp. 3C8_DIV0646]